MGSVTEVAERSQVAERAPSRERRKVAIALFFIGCVALAVAWLGDPRAASFSDSGGRLATVKTMAETNTWLPDLGYWAEAVDPGGGDHPILFTLRYGDRWVEVTSLPLVVVGRPLWEIGGARAVVLLPVLSVVLAAYAARRLSRWASGGDGWLALWFVGLLSPLLFYGADFWEHAPAVALALLAISLILEGGGRRVLLGGLLAGLAAVMRNDLLVGYVALAIGTLVVTEERKRSVSRWRELLLGGSAGIAVLGANALLWRSLFGSAGASVRASERTAAAGLDLAERGRDAVITSVGVFANEYWLALMIGGIIGIGILLLAASAADASSSSSMTGVVGGVVAWGGLLWRFAAFGISTVPGFLTAAPVAALGLFGKRNRREQVLFVGAVVAVPLTWATQWVGGHSPQWGARYLLLPTALLVVLAAGQVRRLGATPFVVALLGLGVVMSAVGAVWHIERTKGIADFAHDVLDVPADVVIVGDTPFAGTEIGSWYGDRRWLSSGTSDGSADPEDLAATLTRAHEAGADRVDVLDSEDEPLDRLDENPTYPGFRYESTRVIKFLWSDVVIRRYVAL